MDPRNAIWVIETVPKDKYTLESTTGGGICFDPQGYILTVAHILRLPNIESADCEFHARPYNEQNLFDRSVKIVKSYPNLDLAVVRVSTTENEESPNLFHVEIPPSVVVSDDIRERLHSWVHQESLPFSFKEGFTCFGFPQNYVVPHGIISDTTRTVIPSHPTSLHIQPYRTLASVAKEGDNFLDLHPNLPLLQVTGFDLPAGSSGFPVYKHATGGLVGLFSISKGSFQYLIPVNFLRYVIDHVRNDKADEWNEIYVKEEEDEEDDEEDDGVA